MHATKGTPSSEFGGRVVLDEAIKTAAAELEAGRELVPLIVTKDWGDCRIERFPHGLDEARACMEELLNTGPTVGHCALVHLADTDDGPAIVVELGRLGGHLVEIFMQRFRPRRGLLRGFKLLGSLVPAGAESPRLAGVSLGGDGRS